MNRSTLWIEWVRTCDSYLRYCHKDESLSHVPLFKNIFRTTINELFDGVVPEVIIKEATELIKYMTEAEIEWTSYIGKDQLGFSEKSIRTFVEGQANSVCRNLKFPLIYEDVSLEDNPLKDLLARHIANEDIKTRSNNFMNNNASYVKGVGFQDDL